MGEIHKDLLGESEGQVLILEFYKYYSCDLWKRYQFSWITIIAYHFARSWFGWYHIYQG